MEELFTETHLTVLSLYPPLPSLLSLLHNYNPSILHSPSLFILLSPSLLSPPSLHPYFSLSSSLSCSLSLPLSLHPLSPSLLSSFTLTFLSPPLSPVFPPSLPPYFSLSNGWVLTIVMIPVTMAYQIISYPMALLSEVTMVTMMTLMM